MQELEPTWQRTFIVWWLIVWRGAAGAALSMAFVGAIFGFVAGITGVSMESIGFVIVILAALVGLLWTVVVVRMALRKQFSKFRIALLPR